MAEEEEIFRDMKNFLDHIRDAVLGMSDGLVEFLSVTAGLAGAYGNSLSVAIRQNYRRHRRRTFHGYRNLHKR